MTRFGGGDSTIGSTYSPTAVKNVSNALLGHTRPQPSALLQPPTLLGFRIIIAVPRRGVNITYNQEINHMSTISALCSRSSEVV